MSDGDESQTAPSNMNHRSPEGAGAPASRSSPVPVERPAPRIGAVDSGPRPLDQTRHRVPDTDWLSRVESLVPAVDAVPADAISDVVLGVGVLQSRLAALQSGLAARALVLRQATGDNDADRWLSVEDMAALMGASTSWVYKHWKDDLPFGFRFGGKLVFPADKAHKFLRRRTADAETPSLRERRDRKTKTTPASRRRGTVIPWQPAKPQEDE